MANRFYTLMLIPERSSRVKKWIVPKKAVRWVIAFSIFLGLLGITTTVMTLRYVAHYGKFREALLENQYLEAQIHGLQNQLASANSTMVRIQNFEQKLRMLVQLDSPVSTGGIGPISKEEEQAIAAKDSLHQTKVAAVEGVSPERVYRMRSLELTIEDLHSRASLQEQSLQELYELLKDQESLLSSTPSIWPSRGWTTSQFGYRISPFTGLRQLHEGVDVAASIGTKVIAPADGVVTHVGTDGSYGKVVVLNHGYGVVTRFAHISEITVKLGRRVRRGDVIALIGNTGRSTGPHLHYEVRVNGIPVNPTRYILN